RRCGWTRTRSDRARETTAFGRPSSNWARPLPTVPDHASFVAGRASEQRSGPGYLSRIPPQEPASVSAPKLTDKPAETLPVQRILKEVSRRIVGQDAMIERLLVGMLTGGHILL